MSGDLEQEEDEREIELSTISAIFPEIRLDPTKPFTASIDLPVVPSTPIAVYFPLAEDGVPPSGLPTPPNSISSTGVQDVDIMGAPLDVHNLSHLPPLHLQIILPTGYPSEQPPVFELSTAPSWLGEGTLAQLQLYGEQLWHEFGQDQVVFAYLDHLQQAAENAFGALDENGRLHVPLDHKIALLDFDIKARRATFEKGTFECGVCLGRLMMYSYCSPKGYTDCFSQIQRRVQFATE